jgi:hypothetical protein
VTIINILHLLGTQDLGSFVYVCAAVREIHKNATLIYYPGRVTGALPNDRQEHVSCSINLGHVTGALQTRCL